MTDYLHNINVSSLTRLQFRLFAVLRRERSTSPRELARLLSSANKSVINAVGAIRRKLGAHTIITTPDGYRLGATKGN